MYRVEFAHPLTTFLFMGCWNKEGCQTPHSGQSKVAALIRKEPAEYPLFLGGDNVYPDKDPVTKKKTYSPQRLAQGIQCLIRDVHRPLFAAIGNHNLPLLPTQLLAPWILPAPTYRIRFSNGSVLVLDSNPWDEGDEKRGRDVLEALETELVDLRSRGEPYYCIMHHPIISYKKKGLQILPNHAAVLDVLIQYPPLILLVADTHNYQKGVIGWKGQKILQIVSGTGGADLDPMEFGGSPKGIEYTLLEGMVAHGYQRILNGVAEFVEVH